MANEKSWLMSESRLDFPRKKRPVFVRVPREFSSTSRRKHTRSKWPQYSINSSARPVLGTLRPSAFAVFRLMYNSTLVTCWTGRSAGFSPLRIRQPFLACAYTARRWFLNPDCAKRTSPRSPQSGHVTGSIRDLLSPIALAYGQVINS
jgi:hypothetical protein